MVSWRRHIRFAALLVLILGLEGATSPARTGQAAETPAKAAPAPKTGNTAEPSDADLYSQVLRRFDMVNKELQATLADADGRGEMPQRIDHILSIEKTAKVTVGGEVRAAYLASKSTWTDPGFDRAKPNRGKAESKTGDLSVVTARLMVDARLHKRWRAFFDLNLHGNNGFHSYRKPRNPNSPGGTYTDQYDYDDDIDFLNQAYIEFMKDKHSGVGFIFGQVRMPFGLWQRPNLFARSFLDAPDLDSSYLVHPAAWNRDVRLPHASRLRDPVVAAMINYEMRDIIRFEAAIFQDKDSGHFQYTGGSGIRHTRKENYPPRSWQVGLSLQPLEGWELTAHFRNRYSGSMGMGYWANSSYRWDFRQNRASGGTDPKWDAANAQWSDQGNGPSFGARSNEQALIIGLAAEIPNTKLSVSAEYAHGWNQGFNKFIDSDSVNLALAYRLTPRLTLHSQGEWLHVRDRSWMTETAAGRWERDTRNNHLYRMHLGLEFELEKSLTLEAGWQYEYWKARSSLENENRVNKANTFYFGTRFIF